jgi:hypothetical protein
MTTKIIITDIAFDTDGDSEMADALKAKSIGKVYEVEHESDEDPIDLLADKVSDNTGWLVEFVSGEIV